MFRLEIQPTNKMAGTGERNYGKTREKKIEGGREKKRKR